MTKTQWELAFDDWPGWRGNDPIRQAFQAGWDAALASHAPSEAAAQPIPTRYSCCGADFAKQHEPHCHNYRTEIEHNDH